VEVLLDYSWPGNVRELINVLEQSILKAWNAKDILPEHLPAELLSHSANSTAGLMKKGNGGLEPVGFSQEIKEKEKQLIISAIRKTKGNKKMAAKLLGMPRSTFYEKMKRYCIAEENR
jgi:transcriptional regulator of acetoin/glycerol metabolism